MIYLRANDLDVPCVCLLTCLGAEVNLFTLSEKGPKINILSVIIIWKYVKWYLIMYILLSTLTAQNCHPDLNNFASVMLVLPKILTWATIWHQFMVERILHLGIKRQLCVWVMPKFENYNIFGVQIRLQFMKQWCFKNICCNFFSHSTRPIVQCSLHNTCSERHFLLEFTSGED